jgi:predicted dehydrogenase
MIDQASWLAGSAPEASSGFLRTANPQRRDEHGEFESTVDDGAFALARYAEGLVARLGADVAVSVDSYTCAVHGEERTAVASGTSITDLALYSIDREETNELQCKSSPYAKFATVDHHVPYLMELYDEFVKAMEKQPNTLPTFDEALSTQRVLASIGYGSA